MTLCKKVVIIAVPPILAVTAVLFSESVIQWMAGFRPCPFYTQLGLLCPACGNTRAAAAFLQGDIFASFRYNLTVPFLILLAAAFYAELCFWAAGRKVVIVPRKNVFLFGAVGFMLVYYAVRNFTPFLAPAP